MLFWLNVPRMCHVLTEQLFNLRLSVDFLMKLLQALLLQVLRVVQNVLKVLVCAEVQLKRTHIQRDRVSRD